MGSQAVTGLDGRRWVVRRRWAPRGVDSVWRRFQRRFRQVFDKSGDLVDADPGCLELFGEGLLAGLAIIAAILLAVFVVIPLLVAVVDLLIVILLFVLGALARIVFRRPWTIEARPDNGVVHEWRVVGWRASDEFRRDVATRLASGQQLPSNFPL